MQRQYNARPHAHMSGASSGPGANNSRQPPWWVLSSRSPLEDGTTEDPRFIPGVEATRDNGVREPISSLSLARDAADAGTPVRTLDVPLSSA